MPEPEPQPPQPRPIPFWKWMLMLLPSLLVLSAPPICKRIDPTAIHAELVIGAFTLPIAIVMCFVLGFFVEKCRRGKIASLVWALDYGFLILVGNGFILFAAMKALLLFEPQ